MSAPAKKPRGRYGQTWSAANPEPPMRKATARHHKEAAYVVRVFRSDNGYTGEVRQLVDPAYSSWGPPLLTTRTYKTTRAAWSALTRAFAKMMGKL